MRFEFAVIQTMALASKRRLTREVNVDPVWRGLHKLRVMRDGRR